MEEPVMGHGQFQKFLVIVLKERKGKGIISVWNMDSQLFPEIFPVYAIPVAFSRIRMEAAAAAGKGGIAQGSDQIFRTVFHDHIDIIGSAVLVNLIALYPGFQTEFFDFPILKPVIAIFG